jgi:hypothetical protein
VPLIATPSAVEFPEKHPVKPMGWVTMPTDGDTVRVCCEETTSPHPVASTRTRKANEELLVPVTEGSVKLKFTPSPSATGAIVVHWPPPVDCWKVLTPPWLANRSVTVPPEQAVVGRLKSLKIWGAGFTVIVAPWVTRVPQAPIATIRAFKVVGVITAGAV